MSDVNVSNNNVNDLQNSDYARTLLRAVHAAHRYVRQVEIARHLVALLLATVALVAAIAGVQLPWLAAVGCLWAVADVVLLRQLWRSGISRAALFQEEFDSYVYGAMPWDETLAEQPCRDLIHSWARRWRDRDGQFRDWYPDVRGLPLPVAVLICQRANLAWDGRLRRRYLLCLATGIVVWTLLGIGVGALTGWSTGALLTRWFAPSSAALLNGCELVWQQYDVGSRKQRMLGVIDRRLGQVSAPPSRNDLAALHRLTRSVQMRLTELRLRTSRVPGYFYRRYHCHDDEDLATAVEGLRGRFAV